MVSFDVLTPLSFLERAAQVQAGHTAVVDGGQRWTYAELHQRSQRLAGSLAEIAAGAPIAVLAPNTHVALMAHFAVPWAGSPLVMINTRLAAPEIRYILEHSGAAALLVDPSLERLATTALQTMSASPVVLAAGAGDDGAFERLISAGEPLATKPLDEQGLLSINYTSGTTGKPKGVMYHHRAAYLQALSMLAHTRMVADSAYLWTLPMFHCNGWCMPWAVTAAAATHVCLPKVEPEAIWQLMNRCHITHMSGAPAVLSAMLESPKAAPYRDGRTVQFLTGGAAPSPSLLAAADHANIEVMQAYGLTETHGPALLCVPDSDWHGLSDDQRARLRARQGVPSYGAPRVRVVTGDGADVPADGATIGEVCLRGNTLMLGYFNDPAATEAATPDGWFHTGDLAVVHPDGYLELRDRKKDIIISGGENIASIEVEQALDSHPSVLASAVVGVPDERWGEVPVAHVELRDNHQVTEQDLVTHLRERLAGYKVPKRVVFGPLPRTSTGKIQKFALRENHRSPVARS